MAQCRGALQFFVGGSSLNTDTDWKAFVGAATGWGNAPGGPSAIPGYFRRQGSALIGDHTAEYREFAVADPNGPVITGRFRVWWLPVSKVFVMSTVDAMYDKDVDHMLATFDFAGYRPPSSTGP